jgi:cephalosporin hydroxylase
MDDVYEREKREHVRRLGEDRPLRNLGLEFMRLTGPYRYTYNFCWMGLPIIQFPQDVMAMQEIIWATKPDLIIETGIARGGSLVFYASMLELLGGNGHVLGIDSDIRPQNRVAIEAHPLAKRISMIEGSSVDQAVAAQVYDLAQGYDSILLVLDSHHTHEHVLRELELYAPLVKCGSYIVVFDTTIEDQPAGHHKGRPWDKGNNPKTAVLEFLKRSDRFVVNKEIENKLLITVARDGFLECIKN